MNARIAFASLLISVAAVPAYAAGEPSDEGLPPNVAQNWKRAQAPMREGAAERFVPQYLHAQGGEVTLTQNPEFMAPQVERTPAAIIRTQSIPATTYVGA